MKNVQPGVEQLFEAPSERTGISLVLGVTDSDDEDVIDTIERTGATVEESLFYGNLVVEIGPDTDLRSLCALNCVETAEIEWKQEVSGTFTDFEPFDGEQETDVATEHDSWGVEWKRKMRDTE